MPTYVFKGRNRLNEIVVGERVAADRAALESMLRREQVILTNAREKGREISLPKLGQEIIFQTRADVEAGMTLADAMAKHPRAFEVLYTNMVAAGETGGILDVILQRLSTYLEKMVKLKSDVKSALIYPIAVILISIIVISIIMIVVIPAFKNIFEGLLGPGEKLPWLTEIVVALSQFLAGYWWLFVLVIGVIVF